MGVLEDAEGLLGVFEVHRARLRLAAALGQNERLLLGGRLVEGGVRLVVADVEEVHDGLGFGGVLLGHREGLPS